MSDFAGVANAIVTLLTDAFKRDGQPAGVKTGPITITVNLVVNQVQGGYQVQGQPTSFAAPMMSGPQFAPALSPNGLPPELMRMLGKPHILNINGQSYYSAGDGRYAPTSLHPQLF